MRRKRRRRKGPKIPGKWTAIGMTPLMCDAMIAHIPKELIVDTRDLRMRLTRLSRCTSTGYKRPWLVVRGGREAKDMILWLRHAARDNYRAAPATKGALFDRIDSLIHFLNRSAIDIIGSLA